MGPFALDIPSLTPLERIGPKGFMPYVFPFELPEDYDPEEVTQVLRAGGYHASSQKLPLLVCEAVTDTSSKKAGVMKPQPIGDGEIEFITSKDLRGADSFPMTFAELKDNNFPLSAFERMS
jgi:hypothetical protein